MPAIAAARHPGAYGGVYTAPEQSRSSLVALPDDAIYGASSPGYSARMIPILGSMVSPPRSATSISAWIAARDAGASCSRFGKPAMKLPASRKVRSSPPSGRGMGAWKVRDQSWPDIRLAQLTRRPWLVSAAPFLARLVFNKVEPGG